LPALARGHQECLGHDHLGGVASPGLRSRDGLWLHSTRRAYPPLRRMGSVCRWRGTLEGRRDDIADNSP
jgi:hypothetical protein